MDRGGRWVSGPNMSHFRVFLIYIYVYYTVHIPSFLSKNLGIQLNTFELKWARHWPHGTPRLSKS